MLIKKNLLSFCVSETDSSPIFLSSIHLSSSSLLRPNRHQLPLLGEENASGGESRACPNPATTILQINAPLFRFHTKSAKLGLYLLFGGGNTGEDDGASFTSRVLRSRCLQIINRLKLEQPKLRLRLPLSTISWPRFSPPSSASSSSSKNCHREQPLAPGNRP